MKRRHTQRRNRSKVYADIAGALMILASVVAFAAWFNLVRIAGAL